MRWIGWGLAAIGIAAGVAWLLWPRPEPPPRYNVLLITIDTARADALNGEDTPALTALAARGFRCRAARTPVPLTLPAHATILTGLEPPAHGQRDNTATPLPEPEKRDYTLLAEEFQALGYDTLACVASAVLDPRYRLGAGFDEYRHPPPPEPGAPAFQALDAEEQVRRFLGWSATRAPHRPYFAWVHLWEPHAPYRPYDGDSKRAGTDAADPAPLRYRGEMRRADAAVEALLAAIDPTNTIVVVTSDHGESLGAHGESTHGYLVYGATMDVPLIFAGPGIPPGKTYDAACSLADIAPTLRRACGLAARRSDGHDLFAPPADRIVVGESLYAHRLFRWAQQAVATDGRFSLVDAGPRLEMFDRHADPGEERPLADPTAHPAYARLDPALMRYRARRPGGGSGAGAEIATAPLYYGSLRIPQGDFLPPKENRALPDVAAGFSTVALLDRATALTAARARAALAPLMERLEAAERADPLNPALPLARGRALVNVLDDPIGARAALRRAADLGYASPELSRLLERAGG